MRIRSDIEAGNPLDRLLPQQDQIDPGRQQKDRRGIWRRSAAHDGADPHASGRGAKDCKRRAGNRVRNCVGNRCRYARAAAFAPARFDEEYRPQENRGRSDESDPGRSLDSVFSSTDLAWKADLQGAQTAVHRVQSGKDLLLERQDDLALRAELKSSKFASRLESKSVHDEIP